MNLPLQPDPLPLRLHERGAVRIGDSRIPLERVIDAFNDGETPERIVDAYDTLRLADVYAVIAYYLNHQADVDAYIEEGERRATELRRKLEAAGMVPTNVRERLLSRMGAMDADPPVYRPADPPDQ